MARQLLFLGVLLVWQLALGAQPIIDMHRHAPLASATDGNSASVVLSELNRLNVVLSVVSVTSEAQLERWNNDADTLILSAMMPCPRNLAEPFYDCFPEHRGLPPVDWLRKKITAGQLGALHEMMFNYDGSLPSAQKMDEYWALAAELDVPVGVHTWSGPPPGESIRRNPNCCPNYNGAIGAPTNLRKVLEKYPGLRIWIQHVGSDADPDTELWEQTLQLLADYPGVYLDLSITNSVLPMEEYAFALRKLITAGFGDRILFGSDNMPIEPILDRLKGVDIVDDKQRQAILYDNAANFLGLPDTIRQQHRQD